MPSTAAIKAQSERSCSQIATCLLKLFEDLESRGVNFKVALLDSWRPVQLLQTLSLYGELSQKAANLTKQCNQTSRCEFEFATKAEAVGILMHEAYQLLQAME